MTILIGTDDDDTLPSSGTGLPGDDSLYGQGGDDTLFGGLGNDYLEGGDGNDHLRGEAGADVFLGGDGRDTVVYADSRTGISIDLTTNINHGGDAEGDRFLDSVEVISATAYADTIIADGNANTLFGLGGD